MSHPGQIARRKTTRRGSVLPVFGLLALMWLLEIVDAMPGVELDQFGIRPRDPEGLVGVVAAPFLHAGFGHLIANTSGLLILGSLVAWATGRFWTVTAGIAVLGGFATWLVASPHTLHIGASGLVYGYAAFLVTWGIRSRRLLDAVLGILVAVMYGGIVWGVLPGQPGISWQGHLFGALAGVVLAVGLTRRRGAPNLAG